MGGRPGERTPSGPAGPLRSYVKGDGAPRGPTLGPLQHNIVSRLCPGDPAPSGPPLGPLMRSVEPPVRAGDQAPREPTIGPPAAQRHCSPVPRGSCTQWATAGAPEAHCGKEWWARQGKEPPTNPGWAEPRTTARSQCSVEAHATRNQQGTRPLHARPTEWGSVCGGQPGQRVEEQGPWASCTRNRSEAGCGRPED